MTPEMWVFTINSVLNACQVIALSYIAAKWKSDPPRSSDREDRQA